MTQNEAVLAELARALNSFPPAIQTAPLIARPELSFALGQLYRRIQSADKTAPEKAALLLNLREFLERRETYTAAESMVNDFATRISNSDPLSGVGASSALC